MLVLARNKRTTWVEPPFLALLMFHLRRWISNRKRKSESEGRRLSLCVPVEARCSRKLKFQPSARSLQSLNAPRRIDWGFGIVQNCKGLSCFSVRLCLTLISLRFPRSPLEILNVLSAAFVSRGHGRAASLGTGAVGNQRERDKSLCQQKAHFCFCPSQNRQHWYDELMHSQVPDFYTDYCGTDNMRAEKCDGI